MDAVWRFVTADEPGTVAAGEALGRVARADDVVALVGGLGAGKTAFTHGVAAGLGIAGRVPSPTFNILLIHRGRLDLNHFDLYRLERAAQLEDIDFFGTVESGGLSVIEWADRFPDDMPDDRLVVGLEPRDDGGRDVVVTATGPGSAALASAWRSAYEESP